MQGFPLPGSYLEWSDLDWRHWVSLKDQMSWEVPGEAHMERPLGAWVGLNYPLSPGVTRSHRFLFLAEAQTFH